MIVQRGDIVLVDFPYSDASGSKPRPALVIQNDLDNTRLVNSIVAQITSLTRRALEPTQCLIDLKTPEGRQSGLLMDSVVNCVNLVTLHLSKVLRKLGSLPRTTMPQIDQCLKTALAIS